MSTVPSAKVGGVVSANATAYVILFLLVALLSWGDVLQWLEVRGEKRKAASRRALARKVQQ